MRIMIDTNVLISMIFFPSLKMEELINRISYEHTIILCSHVVEELNRVTKRKFGHKLHAVDEFLKE